MTSSARNAQSGGFTLIEILVVLAIIALITGAVAERVPGRRIGLQGRAIAHELRDTLRVALEAEGHRVGAMGLKPREIPPPFVARMEATARENIIVFAPDGSSSGGRIDIAAGNSHWPLLVEARTGRVTLVRAN